MSVRAARSWRWIVVAVTLGVAATRATPAAAQPLSVPYLPQSEDLCGGAAAAMVMQYWGASDVYPDAFAPLVDHSAGGIFTGTLTADLERRGWVTAAGPGDRAEVLKELGRRRPVIALIEDRPGRFHYVVVLDWRDDRVTVHDPARTPSRVIPAARFESAWQKSDHWMLILLPPVSGLQQHLPVPGLQQHPAVPGSGAPVAPNGAPDTPAVADPGTHEPGTHEPGTREPGLDVRCCSRPGTACTVAIDAAVARAETDRPSARLQLQQATQQCPEDSAAWRELAGLDALDAKWTEAAAHAGRAVALDAQDSYAWRILATARYLTHDDLGALAAWNRVGEPAVSLVDVRGLQRTRYSVVAGAIGIAPKSILAADALRRGERRVRDIPTIAAARVTFHPVEDSRAQIDAAVVERDHLPVGYPSLIRIGFGAATDREVSIPIGSITGAGDAAGLTWRWWEHRPLVAGFYAVPAPRALGGGVWRLDASRETQTFGSSPFEETRTHVGLTLGNWLTDRTRVTGGAAFDRWRDRPRDVAVSGGVEHWRLADRLRLAADVTEAMGSASFATARATASIRSKTSMQGLVLFGLGGVAAASDTAPASVWPGADTGHARDILLRAHPLLDDGIVTGTTFGRRLAFGSIEAAHWRLLRGMPIRIAPAAFADIARAWDGLAGDSRTQVDVGGGLRLALPGAGTMRVDLAHGLRDGRTALSAGWDLRWR